MLKKLEEEVKDMVEEAACNELVLTGNARRRWKQQQCSGRTSVLLAASLVVCSVEERDIHEWRRLGDHGCNGTDRLQSQW